MVSRYGMSPPNTSLPCIHIQFGRSQTIRNRNGKTVYFLLAALHSLQVFIVVRCFFGKIDSAIRNLAQSTNNRQRLCLNSTSAVINETCGPHYHYNVDATLVSFLTK